MVIEKMRSSDSEKHRVLSALQRIRNDLDEEYAVVDHSWVSRTWRN